MTSKGLVFQRSYLKINRDYRKFHQDVEVRLPVVQLYYGPIEKFGIVKHKPQKLHGLLECLKELSYKVELIPTTNLNILKVIILGYEVHRVNLKFLGFNIDCSYDKVCKSVLRAVEEAVNRLYDNQNIIQEDRLDDPFINLSYTTEESSSNEEPIFF